MPYGLFRCLHISRRRFFKSSALLDSEERMNRLLKVADARAGGARQPGVAV